MMDLKKILTKSWESQTVTEFCQQLRATADELAMINSLVTKDNLVIHALNGIGSDFKEVATVVWAWDIIISFKDLHEKLTDYEVFLTK